jgi:hypothetical protein
MGKVSGRARLDTAPARNGEATSSSPFRSLSQGDVDVAAPLGGFEASRLFRLSFLRVVRCWRHGRMSEGLRTGGLCRPCRGWAFFWGRNPALTHWAIVCRCSAPGATARGLWRRLLGQTGTFGFLTAHTVVLACFASWRLCVRQNAGAKGGEAADPQKPPSRAGEGIAAALLRVRQNARLRACW